MYKPRVVFDFDGVIHSYTSGWNGVDVIPDPPVDGIKEVIDQLRHDGYDVWIVSTRAAESKGKRAIGHWLHKHKIYVHEVSAVKPAAMVYIDDRSICFNGQTDGLVDQIKTFKNWLSK